MQSLKADIPGDTPLDKLDAAIFQWQNWINVRRYGNTPHIATIGGLDNRIHGLADCEQGVIDAVIAWRRSEHRDE